MKKILGLAAGLLLTAATFAQSGVKFNDAGDSYDKATTKTFNFTFDANYSIEQLNKTATFYPDYFTVVSTPAYGGTTVAITLVDDNEMARRVISRYFISLECENVNVNGTDMPLMDFMAAYVQL
jgi:hypothetical protein